MGQALYYLLLIQPRTVTEYNALYSDAGMLALPTMFESRLRLLVALTAPLIISAVITISGILIVSSNTLDIENRKLHQSAANQIARVAADYLAKRDLLSLNVMVDDLSLEQHISLAAIYDPQNRLLAQSGLSQTNSTRLIAEISSQTESLGRLVVEFSDTPNSDFLAFMLWSSIFVYSLIIGLVCSLAYFYGDFLILWVTDKKRPEPVTVVDKATLKSTEVSLSCTLLAIKLTPQRLIPEQEIVRRCQELQGHLFEVTSGEYEIQFRSYQHLQNCLEFTRFIEQLVFTSEDRLQTKMALAQGLYEDHEDMTKRVRYLASLSPGNPLISKTIYDELTQTASETSQLSPDSIFNHYDIKPFHSPLASDIELFSLHMRTDASSNQNPN